MKITVKTGLLCLILTLSFYNGIAQKTEDKKKNTSTTTRDGTPYTPDDFKKSTYYKSQQGGFGFNLVKAKEPSALKFVWSKGSTGNCNNVGFEDTTFTNWAGLYGTDNANPALIVWTNGFMSAGINANCSVVTARHTLMTTPPGNNQPALGPLVGYDSIAINGITGLADIPFLAPGGGHVSVRLGNYVCALTNPTGPGEKIQRLDYVVTVNSNTSEFNYQYAIVLNLPPTGHTRPEMPFVEINVLDSVGNVLNGNTCNSFHVTADSAQFDPTFIHYNGGNADAQGYYKKWTAVSMDLTPYFGRTVTISFRTSDCSRGGHYGYAYIDASCDALRPITGMCPGDSVALLVAPSGYSHYQWLDTLGHPIPAPQGTKDSLLVLRGHPGNVYTVDMISAAGCLTVLKDTLHYSKIQANSISSTKTCFMGHTGTATVIPQGGVYGYTYSWHPPAGGVTQTVSGLLPGVYTVHVSSIRCTTSSFDTMVTVTSLPPPAILSSSDPICKGDTFRFSPPVNPVNAWYMPPSLAPATGIHPDSAHYISQLGIAGVYRDTIRDVNACLLVYDDSLYIVKMTTSTSHIPEHCWMDSVASITLNAFGGVPPASYNYHWTGPNSYVNTGQTIDNLHPGWYTVVTRENGHSCVNRDSLFIVSPPKPKDSLNITTVYCDGDTATTLHFNAGLEPYTWYNNNMQIALNKPEPDSFRIAYPAQYPQYSITYFANGCRRHDTLSLRTTPPPPFEPTKLANVFSPNGDHDNDLFYPFPKTALSEGTIEYYTERYHLEVYDRWGVLVFNTHDYNEGWDGKYQGKEMAPGTYFWIAHYTPRCIAKTVDIVNKGYLDLVR